MILLQYYQKFEHWREVYFFMLLRISPNVESVYCSRYCTMLILNFQHDKQSQYQGCLRQQYKYNTEFSPHRIWVQNRVTLKLFLDNSFLGKHVLHNSKLLSYPRLLSLSWRLVLIPTDIHARDTTMGHNFTNILMFLKYFICSERINIVHFRCNQIT